MRNFFLLVASFLLANSLLAQLPTFESTESRAPLSQESAEAIGQEFSDFQRVSFDEDIFKEFLEKEDGNASFKLGLGGKEWIVDVEPFDPRSEDYVLRIKTDNGIETRPRTANMTYRGFTRGPKPQEICFTVINDFVYGLIAEDGDALFFQSLWLTDPSAPKEDLLLFRGKDGILPDDHMCGTDEVAHESPDDHDEHKSNENEAQRAMMTCFTVEIAIASDFSMFQKFGNNATALEARNAGVIAFVNTDYSGQFANDYIFTVVEQFVSTTSTSDPWTSSLSASALLNSFTGWAPGGFSSSHDLGELWTDRNFTGSTIGVAWLNGLCNSSRYHILQDFTTNSNLTRVLVSHEIGHNFSCNHDAGGSPFIMAPAVQNTSTWSTLSINSVNGFAPNRPCLSSFNCGGPTPPVAGFSASTQTVCEGQQVSFTDQSTGADSWLWTFPGGNPSTSTDQNPVVTYISPGLHDVTLTVTNTFGSDTQTANGFINVDPLPIPNFTTTVIAPLQIEFDNLTAAGLGYSWNFGDGNFSTDFEPTHTYAAPGGYSVVLTAFNACGQVSIQMFIDVIVPPTASFTSTAATGCAPHSVTFTSNSTGTVDTYDWVFPGGNPSTSSDPSPTVVYDTPGSYNVELTVTNSVGSNTLVENTFVTVEDVPTAGFSESVTGTTVDIVDTSTDADSYSYDFGDGTTSTDANPMHTYSMGGTFTITQTVTNTCGSDVATATVTISAAPVASFISSGEACFGDPVTLTSTSTGNVTSLTYDITRPDGSVFTSSQDPFIFTPTQRGSYDVVLTASNASGSSSFSTANAIVVLATPTTSFSFVANGQDVSFNGSVSPIRQGSAATYTWDFGDNNTSTDQNPMHTYSLPGTYTVTLTANNGCEADVATQTITIGNTPTATFVRSPSGDICPGDQVTYTATVNGTATSITWNLPGASVTNPTGAVVNVTYPQSGTFDASIEVCNALGCNTNMSNNEITVQALTVADFDVTTQGALGISITNTATNGTSYSYDFGDGNSSTSENPMHTYNAPGTFTIEQTVSGPCNTDITTETITVGQAPTANFSSNLGNGQLCPGETVAFTSTSTGASTFAWSFPGGTPSSSTSANPVVTYAASGAYDVSLTVTNALGSDTETRSNFVGVNDLPNAAFTSDVNGLRVDFTDQSTTVTSYAWDFGDGNTSTMANPSNTYANAGTFTVTLTATGPCGTDQTSTNVTVVAAPNADFTSSNPEGCTPHSVTFDASSSTGLGTVMWSFPGGTPTTSTDLMPTVVYNDAGSFDASLTVTNSEGTNTQTRTDYVVVGALPVADFTSNITGLLVDFTNQSTSATTFAWDFGDGNTSNLLNPSHLYANAGTFTVTLTASSDCGSDQTTATVTVVDAPFAKINNSTAEGCASHTIVFDATESRGLGTVEWDFPGGTPSTSTELMPTVVYDNPGTFDVTLTVTNNQGTDTETISDLVIIKMLPTASFTSDINELTVTFDNTSSASTSFDWDFGDGSNSANQSPIHTYAVSGTYVVNLDVTNDCGTARFSETITVLAAPVAAFSQSNESGCAPLTVTYDASNSTDIGTLQWTFPGGTPSTSTDMMPTVTYNTAGTFDAQLTVTNASGTDTEIVSNLITVAPLAVAGFNVDVDMLSVDFLNTSTDAISFDWDFGNGQTSTDQNPSITYAAAGSFDVTLTVTNDCGTDVITQTVVVAEGLPNAEFSINETTGCAPLVVNFMDLTTGDPSSWLWTVSSNNGVMLTSTEQNPEFILDEAGVYTVTLEATNGAGSTTEVRSDVITVRDVPTAVASIVSENGATIQFDATLTDADSFLWVFGDGNTSTIEDPLHTYDVNGTYTVTLTATNECGEVVEMLTVDIAVSSVGELPEAAKFNLFPNPASDQVTWILSGVPTERVTLVVTDVLGREVKREQLGTASTFRQNLSLTNWAAGTYVVRIVGESYEHQVRVVKQ
jgi:PKD repeat protein